MRSSTVEGWTQDMTTPMEKQDIAKPDAPSLPTPKGLADPAHASGMIPPPPILSVPLWNNFFTICGLLLVAFSLLLLATFALFEIVSPARNPYVDIIGYLVLPISLIAGIIIVPCGILLKSWRLRRRNPNQRLAFRYPHFDLSDPHQRRVAKAVFLGSIVALPIVGVSSYHGYHYTDSSEFCGLACHSVMEPQSTTYARSPHARVACAECHIGEGAGWFVKSKLSGTRQVLATWRESYSRPIAPAIKHLRPAQDTCEHCHWPQKFYGAQLKEVPRFARDETNEDRGVTMLLNIGGGHSSAGPVEGIHWHMALASTIEYIATDDQLQVIPWIRMTDGLGEKTIYRSDGKPSSDPPPTGHPRSLDCMDCHNRPAHEFRAPQEAVDLMLSAGRIDQSLPFIKREAVKTLVQKYPDHETAERRIGSSLIGFYETTFPELWTSSRGAVNIKQAVDVVREIYRTNFFPEMRVDWQTYPDNIGHLYSPGCFRCHDGKHINSQGKALDQDCNSCHSFLSRKGKGNGQRQLVEGPFEHPFELGGLHQGVRCDQCHSGGVLENTCKTCHSDTAELISGTTSAFARFEIQADSMGDVVDCETCHDASEPLVTETMNETCTGCHDEEEYDGMIVKWQGELKELYGTLPTTDSEIQTIREALRRAGAHHNMRASRKILKALSTGHNDAGSPDGS